MTDGKHASRRRASLLAALCLLAAPAASVAQQAGQKDGARRPPTGNAKPLDDFLAEGKRLLDEGKLGPQTTFDVTVNAEMDGWGHLKTDTLRSNYVVSGGPGMTPADRLVEAISRSRLFSGLEGAKEVRLSLKLDARAFYAAASSELESEEKASQYVTGYRMLLEVERATKRGTPEGQLYRGASLGSEGRRFAVKLELPREAAVRLLGEAVDRVPAQAGFILSAPPPKRAAGEEFRMPPLPAIDVRPFTDLLTTGRRLLDEGRIAPHLTLDVAFGAELDGSGSFKPGTLSTEWRAPGDETTRMLAERFTDALNRSGLLRGFPGAKSLRISLRLDARTVSVMAAGELESEEAAAAFVSDYGALLSLARQSKRGTGEGELYNRLTLMSKGNRLALHFEAPRELVVSMLGRVLDKQAAAAAGRN